jgi:hypothetical protein
MAQIPISVVQTGQPTVSKTYNMADADMDAIIAAYQSEANTSINGTATRAQVLNYITLTWMKSLQDKAQYHHTVPAVVPPPIDIT